MQNGNTVRVRVGVGVMAIGLELGSQLGWHCNTIGTLDVLQACDACADMGMTYSVIVQCADCVVFPG